MLTILWLGTVKASSKMENEAKLFTFFPSGETMNQHRRVRLSENLM